MEVASFEFLLWLSAYCVLYFIIPRRILFTLANLIFLNLFLNSAEQWLTLSIFLLSGYYLSTTLKNFFWTYLALLTAAFLVLKEYSFIGLHPGIHIVGLSYIFFRQIHFLVDCFQGAIKSPSLLSYLNYQLNFFTLLSGPIQRYQDFQKYWTEEETHSLSRAELLETYRRILLGILKIAVVGVYFAGEYSIWVDICATRMQELPLWEATVRTIGIFYFYPAFVYFNFAGYCDIVIGGAKLVGLKLPENFDKPFLARNMIDFWTRWHITLGTWIRDYIFNPSYKALAERSPHSANRWAFACYFLALFLAGVWHGSTANFAIFGLLHGFGVATAKLWEQFIIYRVGRKGLRQYLSITWVKYLSFFITFHFVCITLAFFPPELGRTFAAYTNFLDRLL